MCVLCMYVWLCMYIFFNMFMYTYKLFQYSLLYFESTDGLPSTHTVSQLVLSELNLWCDAQALWP
jgi:hypothetical protein